MVTKRRDAGSGSVFQRKDGKWVATLELGWERGKRKRKVIVRRTKADVVDEQKRLRSTLDSGGTVQTNIPTVERYLAEWLDNIVAMRHGPSTLRSYRSEVQRHIVPFIGRIRLDKLQPRHILDMHKKLRAQAAATPYAADGELIGEASVLKAHAVLSSALNAAVRTYRYIPLNPASSVERPTAAAKRPRRELTLDEALRVLRTVADDPDGSRWAAALMLGARQGELLGLEWDRVDLDTGALDISWQLQSVSYVHGCDPACGIRRAASCPDRRFEFAPGYEYEQIDGALHLVRPKNKRSRVIPVPAHLLAWLRRHRAEAPDSRFVWSRSDGRPISPRADHDRWKGILEQAGVESVPLHSGRHTAASLLLALGVSEPVIMQILGHSVMATTRRYAHVDLSQARAAMDRIGEALALPPGGSQEP